MSNEPREPIAIIGLGCVLPDAPDVATFWSNLEAGRNSIREVPHDRWDPALFWSSDKEVPDKTYAKIGAFVTDNAFDAIAYRLPPKVVEQVDPCQQWALAATRQAMVDAGYLTGIKGDEGRPFDRDRCAVIVGNAMGGEKNKIATKRLFWPEAAKAIRDDPEFQKLPVQDQDDILLRAEQRYKSTTVPITEDTMPGHLSNVVAGRIANTFDLGGKNFTTDAACASSLAALDAAMQTLRDGDADLVVWGGTDRSMDVTPYIQFSKIGALSPDGSRPFDQGANGFVMGEGCAMFLLKRVSDAERDGDKIYGVVRGIGGSSDGKGKGITAPNPAGQVKAVRRAYRAAGVDPATIGYLEAHGTSTPVGDPVELQSVEEAVKELAAAPPAIGSIRVGSVKGNIGHLKAGAGAAGMLKAVLALHHRRIPPSINVRTLNPRIDWAHSPFRVNTELSDWPAPATGPRRAAVSSFGFGGTNFHVVMEEHVPGAWQAPAPMATVQTTSRTALDLPAFQAHMAATADLEPETLVLSAAQAPTAAGLAAPTYATTGEGERLRGLLHPFTTTGVTADERVAFHVADVAEIPKRLALAEKAMADPAAARLAFNQGVFLGRGRPEGKVAFLFPGQGTQYVNMGRDLAAKYEIVRRTFEEADAALMDDLGGRLTDILWPTPDTPENQQACEAKLRLTEYTQPAVLAMDLAVLRLLQSWGIEADVAAGHSLGEYGALMAAGVLSLKDALHAVAARGREMAHVDLPDLGKMASVSADWHVVQEHLAGIDEYVIPANKNCPSQTVIAGSSAGVEAAVTKMQAAGLQCMFLPVSAAFHSEIVAPASGPLRNVLARLDVRSPKIPVISNVGATDYQADPEWIRDNLAVQVASAVEWVRTIERMYAEGVRTFIEVGPKRALTGFVMDILQDKPDVRAMFANHPKQGGVQSLNNLFAFLGASGFRPTVHALDDADVYTAAFRDPAAAFRRTVHVPATPPAPPAGPVPIPYPTTDRFAGVEAKLDAVRAELESLRSGPAAPATGPAPAITVSGISVGLPGRHKPFFSDDNWDRILRGENLIDVLGDADRQAMVDKHITRLVKSAGGQGTFESIDDPEQVIKLAGRRGAFDLHDWGVGDDLLETLDVTSQYAIAAGLEALHDAGIPLQRTYKTTSTGSRLPQGWSLPRSVGDETGIIFASAFPGYDALLQNVQAGMTDAVFNRKFLFHVLSMGHSQLAQFLGARGPNTQVNAACASTTQAIAIAEDWIKNDRCKRVLVVGADDATSPHMMEWIGSGFLASGAATTKEDVAEAALPFDARRHGMIVGMGAVGLVVEAESEVAARGMRPIARLLSTVVSNSAYHGSRLDVDHIAGEMQKLVAKTGLRPADIAGETVFMSHETYTPARGGSAAAEIHALRTTFGDAASKVVVANTKGFTGHPQGAGIEDAVVLKCLQRGTVPPIPHLREPDPALGDLNLSKGGRYDVRYALRLAAGFGSQVAMTFTQLVARESERIADAARHRAWLAEVSGVPGAATEVVDRTLRIVDSGAPAVGTARPTPEPVVADAAPVATAPSQDVLAEVIALVAEKTGYPVEMLEPDLDMEADLGIDTVKQAELFGALRERFGVPLDENLALKDYNTLAKVAAYMGGGTAPAPAAASVAPPAPAPAKAAGTGPKAVAAMAADAVLPEVIQVVADKTGYPVELLEPDLDLESDLGIDTVKQAELFGTLRERFGVPLDENLALKDYNTLRRVAAYMAGGTVAPTTPAPSAPAVPASTTPPPATAAASDAVLAKVTAVVAEKTGYPVELLEPDLDLESDLGIDTVKQAELFGELRETFGVPLDEALSLADYNTLRRVAAYMAGGASVPAVAPTAPPVAATVTAPAAPVQTTLLAGVPDDVLAQVTQVVADKTGYPVELLEPDLDLEADLGIDTVKQAELFGALRERFDVPLDEALSLADYNTLRRVAGYMAQGSGVAAPATTVPTPSATSSTAVKSAVRRMVPRVRPVPLPDADNGIGHEGFVLMLGQTPHPSFEDAWRDAGFVPKHELLEGQTLKGIMFTVTRPDEEDADIWAGQLFDAAKHLQPHLTAGTFVAVVTAQDGAHGLEAPRDGGMAAVTGFAKALRKELPGCTVKAIDLHPEDSKAARRVVAEALQGGPRTEVCYDANGTRFVIDVVPEALPEAVPDVAGKTLVVPGGAQGITAELLQALAPQRPNLLLLGRTPLPEEAATWATWTPEDWKATELQAVDALREAGDKPTPVNVRKRVDPMRKAAEMHTTIGRLEAAGAQVLYVPVDVTDRAGVADAVAQARTRFGSIDGIVHAAGMEISKMLADKPREQFDLVFGIKYLGLEALLAATQNDDLEFLVAFGSVAGRFGNGGQLDYSAVNELLSKEVKRHAMARGIPTAFTVAWGPWGEVGMATRGGIMTVLEQSGVTPIPTVEGTRLFLAELAHEGVRECVVAGELGGLDLDGQIVEKAWDPAVAEAESWLHTAPQDFRLLSAIQSFTPGKRLTATVRLDRVHDAYLMDHAIDGVPLLPGVFGVEAFAEAGRLLADEDQVFHGASDVRFALPLKQLKDAPIEATLDAEVVEAGEDGTRIVCILSTQFTGPDGRPVGEPKIHFEATVRFGPALELLRTGDVPVCDGAVRKAAIYPPFFHGPSFQVLHSAGPLDEESIGKWIDPERPMFAAGKARFLSHPMVTEGLFQLCGLRTMHTDGRMSLPAAIERVDVFPGSLTREMRLWCRSTGTGEDGLRRFDGAACTPEGTVLVRFLGYAMVETGPVALDATPVDAAPAPATDAAGGTTPSAHDLPLPDVDGVLFRAFPVDADAVPDASWFSADERATHAGFQTAKRAGEWLAARLAIKHAVVEATPGLDPLDVTVVSDDHGAPSIRIKGAPSPAHVSITHRDGHAIVAFSGTPLGIDLETIESRADSWWDQAFGAAERAHLRAQSEPDAASACAWAAKEAALKRHGHGLDVSLHALTVRPDGEGGATVEGPFGAYGVRFFDVEGRVLAVSLPAFDVLRNEN